jgi:hypothetical protein
MANLIFSILSEYNGKGLAKGKKDVLSFEKSIKNLGKALGVTFSAAAIVNFSKKTISAFMADEAAAKSLEQQLKNTGYAFSSPDVEYYIANLQKMTGVLDDQLRPAFQTLLTASGSLTKSQKALALALDISAGTGKSVEEVSMALAKGFSGQTTALSRLGAGLDKATLASGDMNKIMDELQNKFSGQAQARLGTYAGKMDQFRVASANASEAIGKGILNALSAIGKDKNLEAATTAMENFGTSIANVITGLGVMLGKLTSIAQNSGLTKLLGFVANTSLIGLIAKLGAKASADFNAPSSNFQYSLGANAGVELAKLQELKARKTLITTLKAEADLKKLKDKYDLERIGLMAALNQATDDETKLRLAEKLAILDGNAAMAQKYLADLKATDSTTQLATAMNQAAMDILTAGQKVLLGLGVSPSQMAGSTITGNGGFTDIRNLANVALNNPNFGTSPEAMGLGLALGFTPGSTSMGAPTETPPINLQLVVDGSAFATAVQYAQLTNNRNGITTVPAGQGF